MCEAYWLNDFFKISAFRRVYLAQSLHPVLMKALNRDSNFILRATDTARVRQVY